jgi:hypothetical protein
MGGLIMQEPESYGKVKYTRVKAALKQIEEHYADCPERLEDVNITFEYLVGSFFPTILKNIDKELNRYYTLGYIQGRKEANGENGLEEVIGNNDN